MAQIVKIFVMYKDVLNVPRIYSVSIYRSFCRQISKKRKTQQLICKLKHVPIKSMKHVFECSQNSALRDLLQRKQSSCMCLITHRDI